MSAIGATFLNLNLVLAAVFLGFAANQLSQSSNVSESLRAEKAAHEATKKSTSETITAMTAEVDRLKTETSTLRDDRDTNKLTADRNGQELAHERDVMPSSAAS